MLNNLDALATGTSTNLSDKLHLRGSSKQSLTGKAQLIRTRRAKLKCQNGHFGQGAETLDLLIWNSYFYSSRHLKPLAKIYYTLKMVNEMVSTGR